MVLLDAYYWPELLTCFTLLMGLRHTEAHLKALKSLPQEGRVFSFNYFMPTAYKLNMHVLNTHAHTIYLYI